MLGFGLSKTKMLVATGRLIHKPPKSEVE
jgi:hypothetical protein